jgi:membrane protein DedA with SNARE-associated domain
MIGREAPTRFGPARGMAAAALALLLCAVAVSLPYVVGLPPFEFLLFLVMTLSGALLWCGWYVLLTGALAGWLLRSPGRTPAAAVDVRHGDHG